MKKIIPLLLISGFCGLTLFGCSETSEVNHESNLPSVVESAESAGISASKRESQNSIKSFAFYSGDYLEIEKKYDISGNLLEDKDFSDSWSWVEYTYDNKGNILTETEYEKNGGSSVTEYTYINQDKYPEITITNFKEYSANGTLVKWTEPTYDNSGNLQKNTFYNEDNSVSKWNEYTYDSEGNMLMDFCYNGDGSLYFQCEYAYENDGYKSIKTIYSSQSDNSIFLLTECSYDGNGFLITEKTTSPNGNGSAYFLDCEITYDSNGNALTKTFHDRNGFLDERIEYTYDDNGNMTEKDEEYGFLKAETLYCYTESVYDKIGNLRDKTETYYEIDGSVISSSHSIYDEWGQCLGVDNGSNNYEITYDDTGNFLEIVQYESESRDKILFTTEFIYNKDGKLQTVLCYGRTRDTLRNKYEYTYDNDGNPLVRTAYDEEENPTSNITYEYY